MSWYRIPSSKVLSRTSSIFISSPPFLSPFFSPLSSLTHNNSDLLPMYLSEDLPEFLDFFPLLKHYRDIVYIFKFTMAPDASSFPPVRPWLQKSASLRWKFDKAIGFKVVAFGKELQCVCAPGLFCFVLFCFCKQPLSFFLFFGEISFEISHLPKIKNRNTKRRGEESRIIFRNYRLVL